MNHESGYGLWGLVFINSVIFIVFAFSFFKPQTKTDWRTFGSFSAFIIALFIEMYGFPLTIYLLSGFLAKYYPGLDLLNHNNGHLLHTLLGLKGDPHFDVLHILSNILIIAGFILLSASWKVLYQAQKAKSLAVDGPYSFVRHPQYDAFVMIMLGFLLQWPTILTLIMFPMLVATYVHLSKKEERVVESDFPEKYQKYKIRVPRFFPRLSKYKLEADGF